MALVRSEVPRQKGPGKKEWNSVQEKIVRLYIDERKSLDEVRQLLEIENGFYADTHMYKKRLADWNVKKSFKVPQYRALLEEAIECVEHDRPLPQVFNDGRPVQWSRIYRHFGHDRKYDLIFKKTIGKGSALTIRWPEVQEPQQTKIQSHYRQHNALESVPRPRLKQDETTEAFEQVMLSLGHLIENDLHPSIRHEPRDEWCELEHFEYEARSFLDLGNIEQAWCSIERLLHRLPSLVSSDSLLLVLTFVTTLSWTGKSFPRPVNNYLTTYCYFIITQVVGASHPYSILFKFLKQRDIAQLPVDRIPRLILDRIFDDSILSNYTIFDTAFGAALELAHGEDHLYLIERGYKLLELCRASFGEPDPATLHAYETLARLHYSVGSYDAARELSLQMLKIHEQMKCTSIDSSYKIGCMQLLAAIELKRQDLNTAEFWISQVWDEFGDELKRNDLLHMRFSLHFSLMQRLIRLQRLRERDSRLFAQLCHVQRKARETQQKELEDLVATKVRKARELLSEVEAEMEAMGDEVENVNYITASTEEDSAEAKFVDVRDPTCVNPLMVFKLPS